jgi:AhpD family alkylhydroperoxidase
MESTIMGMDHVRAADDVVQASVALTRGIPETMAGFSALGKGAYADKALSRKFKELIALALGVAARCDGCVAYHARKVADLGVTRDEVLETLGVCVQMGGGPSMVYGGDALRAYDAFVAEKQAKSAA